MPLLQLGRIDQHGEPAAGEAGSSLF